MKKRSIFLLIFVFLISTQLYPKTLDQAFSEIFSKLLKQFSYEGEVVAIIPERDEAAVQFENNFIPPIGAEVTVYRHQRKLFNQLTGKFIGYLDEHVGTISIKDKVGTVALGDIVENPGHMKAGDNARFTKRVVIYVKGINNLTEKPTQAYDIQSYLELAAGKFPQIQLIFSQNPMMQQKKDVYPINMKVFIKDSISNTKKDVSIEFSSVYTGRNIGVFTSTFDLSKKMLSFKAQTPQALISKISQPQGYPGLPAYPMGPTANLQPLQPVGQGGQLPTYPMAQGQVSGLKPIPLKPVTSQPQEKKYKLSKLKPLNSKYKYSTLENLKPTVTNFRTITQLTEKLKSIDFNNSNVVYSDGYSIVFAKIVGEHALKKLYGETYKGFGQIMNVAFVDANNDGKKDVIVNIILKDGMESRIYKIAGNKLILAKNNIDYILGGYDFDNDGKEELAGQSFDKENIFGDALYELELKGNNLERKKRVWIPYGFRLPSSVKADVDGDGKKELLFINDIHRLIVYKNGENIYTGDESLGGSFNIISWNKGTEKFQYTKPQAIDPKPKVFMKDKKGREGVLIVKNYATGDIILGDIGLFKQGEVRLVFLNSFGDIAMKPYSGKVDGAIEGINIYNNELICGVIKKSSVNPIATKAASYLIAFPAY